MTAESGRCKFPAVRKTAGYTLVELVTALTIATIATALILAAGAALGRSLKKYELNFGRIFEMADVKTRLDNECSAITDVYQADSGRMEYRVRNDTTIHRLQFRSGTLSRDGVLFVRGVRMVHFKRETGRVRTGLFWSATTQKGGWVGGAVLLNN